MIYSTELIWFKSMWAFNFFPVQKLLLHTWQTFFQVWSLLYMSLICRCQFVLHLKTDWQNSHSKMWSLAFRSILCFLSVSILVKLFSQSSHLKVSEKWIFSLWSFSASFDSKYTAHLWHLKFPLPSCLVSRCLVRVVLVQKLIVHWSQEYLSCPSLMALSKCLCKFTSSVNVRLHLGHLLFCISCCNFMCTFNDLVVQNSFPQTLHTFLTVMSAL